MVLGLCVLCFAYMIVLCIFLKGLEPLPMLCWLTNPRYPGLIRDLEDCSNASSKEPNQQDIGIGLHSEIPKSLILGTNQNFLRIGEGSPWLSSTGCNRSFNLSTTIKCVQYVQWLMEYETVSCASKRCRPSRVASSACAPKATMIHSSLSASLKKRCTSSTTTSLTDCPVSTF